MKTLLKNKQIWVEICPVIISYVVIATAYGATAKNAGFDNWLILSMSIFVFAGASQFLAVALITKGFSIYSVILATFIINMRHFMMSVSSLGIFRKIRFRWRTLLKATLTDESFVLIKFNKNGYFRNTKNIATLHALLYVSWSSGTILGILISGFVPEFFLGCFEFGIYALFIGLIIPEIRKTPVYIILIFVAIILHLALLNFVSNNISIIITSIAAPLLVYIPSIRKKIEKSKKMRNE